MWTRAARRAGIGCLAVLLLSCAGVGVAVYAHILSTFTLYIPLQENVALVIHSGTVPGCPPILQTTCSHFTPDYYAFYIHYVIQGTEHSLISISSTAP
jgi:hypothetical protein